MNAIASLMLAAYLATALARGNGPELWAAIKYDAPNFLPWLVSVLLLILLYQSRGFFGPASGTVAAVVVGGALAVLIISAPAFSTAVRDISKLLQGA